ncbi:hypothetical protein SDC9_209374 [bioreactor metagenome]|uniref:Uncharacterized protein n=1 Tax=bioreactor metagenome TaxID=1076179 RepID=A0A645JDU5_9ZZZZ
MSSKRAKNRNEELLQFTNITEININKNIIRMNINENYIFACKSSNLVFKQFFVKNKPGIIQKTY